MKIAVIFTGGTIGSSIFDDGYIRTTPQNNNGLLQGLDADFSVFEPYTTLSEQLDGDYITKLVSCVNDRLLEEKYDGIIITHGTDTLQYSASALALAFGDCNIPIVLVSSNFILTDPRSNGRDNMKFAFEFLKEKIGGVFVSYKNSGEAPEIHVAKFILPHRPYNDTIRSMHGPFGRFEDDSFIRLIRDYEKDSYGIFRLNRLSSVLWIKAHAGMRYPEAFGAKAVLIESYHSGTLPTLNRDFVEFCKNCRAPLYLTGAGHEEPYESSKLFSELGIRVLPETSPIYAYMKLWVVSDNGLNYNI
ncbi:MAG: asparaginase [Ruminococcus sp.]|nr:asparaginase [Ruminococcus sp.]